MSKKRKFEDDSDTIPTKRRRIDDDNEWWKGQNNNNDNNQNKDEFDDKNELIDYFGNIDYMITNESFDDENEQIFINNIIREIENFNDIIFIFEHPDISKVIEKLIEMLSSVQIRQFILKFIIPNLFDLMSKKCSSHVLQTLFALIPRILIEEYQFNDNNTESNNNNNNDNDKFDDESIVIPKMTDLLIKIIEILIDSVDDNYKLIELLFYEESNFIIRDLLWITSGVVRFDKMGKKSRMKLHHIRKIPLLQKFNLNHIPVAVQKFAYILSKNLLKYINSKNENGHEYKLSFFIKQNNIFCASICVLIECLFITKSNDILQDIINNEI